MTVNTHKGFSRLTRLQFGVHSPSRVFQREIENTAAHIPFAKVCSDDIFISSRNDKEHLENLLFKKMDYDLNSENLGFKINKNGVTPIKEKFENIKTTIEPRMFLN